MIDLLLPPGRAAPRRLRHLRFLLLVLVVLPVTHLSAQASRDYVYMVGSSTVYPFATVVAERFGRSTPYKTPKVEATGSGGGFKLFCDGLGVAHPDITIASRRIKATELEACRHHGVDVVVEIKIGYDGIVIANAAAAPQLDVTLRELFLALAARVPGNEKRELIDNPYRRWSDIDARLPEQPIEIYGPPPTSGTRDELVEIAMQRGCHAFPWLFEQHAEGTPEHRRTCYTVREDGAYIEAGENDNLIVQKLLANENAYGIFGYSFVDQNPGRLKGARIEGVEPTYDSIAAGDYPISRPLYFYVKKSHVGVIPGLQPFLAELTSARAMGENGYLSERGLITMPFGEREAVADTVREMTPRPIARSR